MWSIIHWHQQTFPADWNRQACTELTENTLMGWPWFPGQMGDSWCGTQPVWTYTFCDSHRQASAKEGGGAAAHTETEKTKKTMLTWTKPISFNQLQLKPAVGWAHILRPMYFLCDLGRRLKSATREPNSSTYFLQRISVAFQVDNLTSVLGSLPDIDT